MFDQTSRYYNLKNLVYKIKEKNGEARTITYKERRFLPKVEQMNIIQNVSVLPGERLDNFTYRTIGDPELFWHICDANEAMHPLEMTREPGRILNIGIPKIR